MDVLRGGASTRRCCIQCTLKVCIRARVSYQNPVYFSRRRSPHTFHGHAGPPKDVACLKIGFWPPQRRLGLQKQERSLSSTPPKGKDTKCKIASENTSRSSLRDRWTSQCEAGRAPTPAPTPEQNCSFSFGCFSLISVISHRFAIRSSGDRDDRKAVYPDEKLSLRPGCAVHRMPHLLCSVSELSSSSFA